jgi:hypothetical protein
MPIYTYTFRDSNGEAVRFEAMQDRKDKPYKTLRDVDLDSVLTCDGVFTADLDTKVTRIVTAPASFRGLPTPKFHG